MSSKAVFAALADPTRRAILELLQNGGELAGSIADRFDVSWPAVSRHLRILKAAGLVWETREGRSRYYEVNHRALTPVHTWLAQFQTASVHPVTPSTSTFGSVGRESSS